MADSSIFLTAEWRYLAMLNYVVDPALLLPFVPTGTELDSWEGKTFVSIVGFLFQGTRVLGLPIPFHQDFEEVNLRFYVRRFVNGELRRGVVFIREIVPKPTIAMVARMVYNEKYISMPMRSRLDLDGEILKPGGSVEYGWRFNKEWNLMKVTTTGEPMPTAEGSEEEFITEHYWGYAMQRNGETVEYRVEHPRWRVWSVGNSALHCNTAELYGELFAPFLNAPPNSAFLAEGSPIIVRKGARL